MTMEMAIYISIGILTIWAFAMLAWAVWSKKQENPEFSFMRHVRNLKMSTVQYNKFAASARIMMYLYAFLAGMAWGKGDILMAVMCASLFFGIQALLFLVSTRWLSSI